MNLPAEKPAPKPPVAAGGVIAALVPQTLDECFRLARAFAGAGDMVPKHYQGQPEMAMAAIIKGLEIGLAPHQALSSIAVINGRATLWGDALPALMQRAGHHVDVELAGEGDSLTAVATLTRGDTGKTIVRRFSLADAKRANLLGKPGPWQNYTGRMLSMRARAWAIRDGAADALMGLQIADEAEGPDRARDITPAAPRRGGTIWRDEEPTLPPPAVDDVLDLPTEEQRAAAMAEVAAELAARPDE